MNKVALVTGGGSGIGKAVALALSHAGHDVVLLGRQLDKLNAVKQQANGKCLCIVADVTSPNEVDAAFAQIETHFGRLDVLFNNAGAAAPSTPFEDVSAQQWHAVVDTNLNGAFLCAQGAYRLMKRQRPQGGRIINNGSIAASVPRPRMAPYTASKHAISGLTKTIALEGRAFDIACGQIDIGNTTTALLDEIASGTLQADMSVKAEPTFEVKHVADAVLYMVGLPLEANVMFMTVMATKMPYIGRG